VLTCAKQKCLGHLLRDLKHAEQYKRTGGDWKRFANKLGRLKKRLDLLIGSPVDESGSGPGDETAASALRGTVDVFGASRGAARKQCG
jgi:hypothetical protein